MSIEQPQRKPEQTRPDIDRRTIFGAAKIENATLAKLGVPPGTRAALTALTLALASLFSSACSGPQERVEVVRDGMVTLDLSVFNDESLKTEAPPSIDQNLAEIKRASDELDALLNNW